MIVIAFLQNLFKKLAGIGFNSITDSLKAIADMIRKLLAKDCPGGLYFDAEVEVRGTKILNNSTGQQSPLYDNYSSRPLPPRKYYFNIQPNSYCLIDLSDANLKEVRDIWLKHITLADSNVTNVNNADVIAGIGFDYNFVVSGQYVAPQKYFYVKALDTRADDYAHTAITETQITFDKGVAEAVTCDITTNDIGRHIMCSLADNNSSLMTNQIRKITNVSITGDVVVVTIEQLPGQWINYIPGGSTLDDMAATATWVVLEETTVDDKRVIVFEMPSAEASMVKLELTLKQLSGYDVDVPDWESNLTFVNMKYDWYVTSVTGEDDKDFNNMELIVPSSGDPKIIVKNSIAYDKSGTALQVKTLDCSDLDAIENFDNQYSVGITTGPFGRQFDSTKEKVASIKLWREHDVDYTNMFTDITTALNIYENTANNFSTFVPTRHLFFDMSSYPYNTIAETTIPITTREFKVPSTAFFIFVSVATNQDEADDLVSGSASNRIELFAVDESAVGDKIVVATTLDGISTVEKYATVTETANVGFRADIRFKVTLANDSISESQLFDKYTFIIAKHTPSGTSYSVISKIDVTVKPGIMMFPNDAPDSNGDLATDSGLVKLWFNSSAISSNGRFSNGALKPALIYNVDLQNKLHDTTISYNRIVFEPYSNNIWKKKIVRAKPVGGETFTMRIVLLGMEQSVIDGIDTSTNINAYMSDLNIDGGAKILPTTISVVSTMSFKNLLLLNDTAETVNYIDLYFDAATMHTIAQSCGVGTALTVELINDDGELVTSSTTLVYIPPIINLSATFTNVGLLGAGSYQSYGENAAWAISRQQSTNDATWYALYGGASDRVTCTGSSLEINGNYMHRVLKTMHINLSSDVPARENTFLWCDGVTPSDHEILYCTNYCQTNWTDTSFAIPNIINVNGQPTGFGIHEFGFFPGLLMSGLQDSIIQFYGKPMDLADNLQITTSDGWVNPINRTANPNGTDRWYYFDDPVAPTLPSEES